MVEGKMYEFVSKEFKKQENFLMERDSNYSDPEVLQVYGTVLVNETLRRDGRELVELAHNSAKKVFGAARANLFFNSSVDADRFLIEFLLSPRQKVLYVCGFDGPSLNNDFFEKRCLRRELFPSVGAFDYEGFKRVVEKYNPDMVLVETKGFMEDFDYGVLREALGYERYFVVDLGSDAGMVSGGALRNPVLFADAVSFSTKGTMRGPVGGGFVSIDSDLFGRRFDFSLRDSFSMADFAAKYLTLLKNVSPEWDDYVDRVRENARSLSNALKRGFDVLEGGKYFAVVDAGKEAGMFYSNLRKSGIFPELIYPVSKPDSGLLVFSTSALTSREFGKEEFNTLADAILKIFHSKAREARVDLEGLIDNFPIYVL